MAVFNSQGSQFFSHARGRILLKADLWCNNPMQCLKTTKKGLQSLIQSLAVLHRILSTSQQCLLRFEAQFSKAVDHVGDLRGKNQLHKLWQDIATLPSAKIHTSFVSTDQKNRSTECIMTFGMTFGDTALPKQQSLTYDIIWHMTILIHIQVCVQINKISIDIPENWRSWLQICDTIIFALEKTLSLNRLLRLKSLLAETIEKPSGHWVKKILLEVPPADSTVHVKKKSLSFLAGFYLSKCMKSSSQPQKKSWSGRT